MTEKKKGNAFTDNPLVRAIGVQKTDGKIYASGNHAEGNPNPQKSQIIGTVHNTQKR